jgi:hypothetical protein
MERKEKVVYNYELLLKVLERDGAKINEKIELPKRINSTCYIDFICNCGKEEKKAFRSIYEYIGAFCKACVDMNRVIKLKQTNLERYGVENISQLESIKKKKEETCLQNNGVKYYMQSEKLKQKAINTNLEKYGKSCTLQVEEVKQKIKQTNLEKYGKECTLQVKEIRDKGIETNLKKYGVKNVFQSKEIKQKIKKTNLERYGVEHNLQNPEIKQKIKKTNLERYGFEHPQQNSIISEKTSKCAYKLKSYFFPSGKEIKVQGYENIALDILFKEGILEEDILINRTEVPEIWWVDNNGKTHRYYVDIFIKSENKFIEVKSTWTYSRDDKKEKIEKTKEAVKEKGYLYELWIIDKCGKVNVIN